MNAWSTSRKYSGGLWIPKSIFVIGCHFKKKFEGVYLTLAEVVGEDLRELPLFLHRKFKNILLDHLEFAPLTYIN